MPYEVLGKLELEVSRVNFVVCHDFFDTCEATRILFKPIVERHLGCQVLVFNYPCQAGTRFPVPSSEEARHQDPDEASLNNDWCAARLHELLQHVEACGEMLLTSPFHMLGIGNGLSLAAAFANRYGRQARYRDSMRSIVSINGFASVDTQLAAILHSSIKVSSTHHTSPVPPPHLHPHPAATTYRPPPSFVAIHAWAPVPEIHP